MLVNKMVELLAALHAFLKIAQRSGFSSGVVQLADVFQVKAARAVREILQTTLAELELIRQIHG